MSDLQILPVSPNDTASTPATEPPKLGTTTVSAIDDLFQKSKSKETPVPVEAKTEKPETKESQTKLLAVIAREQKRISQEKDTFNQTKAQHQAQLQELEQLRQLKNLVKSNPLKALTEFGLDYNQLIELELQNQAEAKDPTLKKVRDLETKLKEKETKEQELILQTERNRATSLVATAVEGIKSFVSANQEKYEFINKYNAEKVVWDKIQEVFDYSIKRNKQGEIVSFTELTNQEACDLIEAEFEMAAEEMINTKKIQNKFKQTKQPEKDTKEVKSKVTLSNTLSQEPVTQRTLSKAERAKQAWERLSNS